MAALNVDTDGFRRTGELVDLAGALLGSDFDDPTPTPPCASDQASETIMRNLNARHDWLLQHVRAGAHQASNAASGMNDTATEYDTQDQIAAAAYHQFGGGGSAGSAPAPAGASQPPAKTPAPVGMPDVEPVPDVSGTEGESLALQLETGAGPGPALAAGAKLTALATRAQAANASLADAHAALLGTGESQATPGMAAKLTRGIAFTEAVATHATALAGHYEAAGNLHTVTYGQVGPSAGWQALKTGYAESQLENALNGGLSQAKVEAFKQALDDKEQVKGAAATGLQNGGTVVSTPPGGLPDPGMDPNGQAAPGDDPSKGKKDGKDAKSKDDGLSSGGDMMEPLMGALGPLTQSLGKANPLKPLGQVAQQLGQQVSKLGSEAAKKAAAPLKPAALGQHLPDAKKGAGGGGGKGGGSPIKPSSNLPSATRAASLGGTPSATPASAAPPIKPVAAGTTGASGGGGSGMMPMGHKPGGDSKAAKIEGYEQPLPEVESTGRAGVVGEVARPAEPVVNPEAQNAVKARMERRKKGTASAGDE